MNLSQFLFHTKLQNVWIREPHISVYIRRSVRFIGDKSIPCLDIGSVEVDENFQGQGVFTTFLERFECEAKQLNRAVFIESILTHRFQKYLASQGYTPVPGTSDLAPNMYKFPA